MSKGTVIHIIGDTIPVIIFYSIYGYNYCKTKFPKIVFTCVKFFHLTIFKIFKNIIIFINSYESFFLACIWFCI